MPGRTDTVRADLEDAVLALQGDDRAGFDALDEAIHAFQREHNPVVRAFGDAARHLPIAAFRRARVATFPEGMEEVVFRSSGTSSAARAIHPVHRLSWYERIVETGFGRAFPAARTVLGYLPAYADDSSLVHMVRHLARRSGGAVFEDDPARLAGAADSASAAGRPAVVVGAAFGLLDVADRGGVRLPGDTSLVETGGMKTHRRSVTRDTLHARLAEGFGLARDRIGSEYGMCELTSQSWAVTGDRFRTPPWMRVEIVDAERPDRPVAFGERGLIAVTDLGNIYSASRILTEDAGREHDDGFEVLGRASGAELRGCNFLVESRL